MSVGFSTGAKWLSMYLNQFNLSISLMPCFKGRDVEEDFNNTFLLILQQSANMVKTPIDTV